MRELHGIIGQKTEDFQRLFEILSNQSKQLPDINTPETPIESEINNEIKNSQSK